MVGNPRQVVASAGWVRRWVAVAPRFTVHSDLLVQPLNDVFNGRYQ